nr:MAG TPA: hypothetical protein [Caudoviricetes sp.]
MIAPLRVIESNPIIALPAATSVNLQQPFIMAIKMAIPK